MTELFTTLQNSSDEELKPCPFCGGNNTEKLNELMIGCHDCHVVVKLWGWGFGLNDDIEKIWNKRAETNGKVKQSQKGSK